MTRDHDEASHPAPERDRVKTHETLFAVAGAPLAWLVQLITGFAFSTTPCFHWGSRLYTHPGLQSAPLIVGVVCFLVALASLWLGILLLRRTKGETGHSKRHLLETGQGRTRFLAVWAIAFASVCSLLIAVNLVLLVGLRTCAA